MSEIVLKRANVVKRVDSEDKAKALETRGFVRTDGKTAKVSAVSEKELADTREQLQEAEKKIQTLEADLAGTKDQLETAVKKNKEMSKK